MVYERLKRGESYTREVDRSTKDLRKYGWTWALKVPNGSRNKGSEQKLNLKTAQDPMCIQRKGHPLQLTQKSPHFKTS